MKNRDSRRLNVFFSAVLYSDSVRYDGFIGNVSERGIYMRIRTEDAEINFRSGTVFHMIINLISAKPLKLRCRIVWAYEIPIADRPGKSAYNLGLETVDDVPGFINLYKNEILKNLDSQIKLLSE